VCFCFSSLAFSVCAVDSTEGCSKARVKKKMALQEVSERIADVGGFDGDEAKAYGEGAQTKHLYGKSSLYPTGFSPFSGFVCTYGLQDLHGADDYYYPTDQGRPVVGNYITPGKFHWRLRVSQVVKGVLSTTDVTNLMSFRLIFMLVWQFPKGLDVASAGMLYGSLFNPSIAAPDGLMDFIRPEVSEKCVLLYDCIHTIGGESRREWSRYGIVSKVAVAVPAYAQAAYVVPPFAAGTNPGWPVPAAAQAAYTDSAINTTENSVFRVVYGGHQVFLDGVIDVSEYVSQMSLWRDPEGLANQQLVPCIVCYINVHPDYLYSPAYAFDAGSRPAPRFDVATRLDFTDE